MHSYGVRFLWIINLPITFVITFSLALISNSEPDEEAKKDIRIDALADATLKAMSNFLVTQRSFHLEAPETLGIENMNW